MAYNVAVVGATGNVGREILQILAERRFPAKRVQALASKRSVGQEVSYGEDDILKVEALDGFDFSAVDIVLSSAGGALSKAFAPRAGQQSALVIDNTSQFRYDPDCPLIVPEVNGETLADYFRQDRRKNIIANPNCSTIQMVVALKPLHDAARIKRVVVSTYQSVSGAGKAAMDELFNQTRSIYVNDPVQPDAFPKQIAFNVIPQIGDIMEDGTAYEEWKMMAETKRILDPSIKVAANVARVPVFIGHSEYVNLEFEQPLSADAAKKILSKAAGVVVFDKRMDAGYVTPQESAGEDPVYVSRIREDSSVEQGLSLWIVADNLRKGAALNTVQIAELVTKRGWLSPKAA